MKRKLHLAWSFTQRTLFLGLLTISISLAHAQVFHLDVVDGYGDGDYVAGDTVHVWSRELSGTEVFGGWTGASVDDAAEWHTTLVMPAAATTVTAGIQSIGAINPTHVQIMGRDNLKEVFYHFPAGYKGVVYFLHGSNGSANGWLNFTNNLQMVKEVVADGFGIVITEAEEITLNMDLDGDSALRWLPDSAIDYANIQIITDTLIAQGHMQPSDKRFTLGMSNGASFAVALGDSFGYDGIVSHCSPGFGLVSVNGTVPTMWVMTDNDMHPSVGQQGNFAAYQIYQALLGNGVCADYRLVPESPLHRERFARIAGITVNQSQLLVDELDAHGWLDANGFLTATPDDIIVDIRQDTAGYPRYYSIPGAIQRTDYANEIAAAFAEHQMNVEKAKKVLLFLNDPCFSTGIDAVQERPMMELWPNPCSTALRFFNADPAAEYVEVLALDGRLMRRQPITLGLQVLQVEDLASGVYVLHCHGLVGRFVRN